MARVTPDQYAEDWASGLTGRTDKIRRGVDRVTQAPGQAAAAAESLMKAKLLKAIEDGTWKRMVSSVTLDEWKNAMKDLGIGRISAGVDKAKARQVAMASKLLPAVDAAAAKVRTMPKGSVEDSVNRASTFIREMAKTKGTIRR